MTFPQTCVLETMAARTEDRVPPLMTARWLGDHLKLLHEDDLPIDPRSWNRTEVARWVSHRGGLPERFPMNGKALCLMTRDMFAARVPRNGHELYQDFRQRLAKALALQDFFEKMTPK